MEFSIVELPFKCASINEATRIHNPKESKNLTLHPNLPPIPAATVKGCGLVLDVSNMKIVGKISTFTRFRHMADFYLPSQCVGIGNDDDGCGSSEIDKPIDYLLSEKDSDELQRLNTASSIILNPPPITNIPLFVPPTLSTFAFPHQTHTIGNANTNNQTITSSQTSQSKMLDTNSCKRGKQSSWIVQFSDFEKEVFAPKELLKRVCRLYLPSYERVKALFEERPIYLRSAIRHSLLLDGFNDEIPELELRAIMPTIAYFFMDGPWRSCWVRYGYDPRKKGNVDVGDARLYQVLELRNATISQMIESFPSPLRKKVVLGQKKEKMYMAPIFDGTHILTDCMSQFQYIDLTYQVIRSHLLNLPIRDELDRREGWFPDGTNSFIRKILIERWFYLLKEMDSSFYDEFQKSSESIYKSIRASVHQKEGSNAGDDVDVDVDCNMNINYDNIDKNSNSENDNLGEEEVEDEIMNTSKAVLGEEDEEEDIYELLF